MVTPQGGGVADVETESGMGESKGDNRGAVNNVSPTHLVVLGETWLRSVHHLLGTREHVPRSVMR